MIEIISWHGGTIDKFIGDAIMVFWGAPKDLLAEEQARQASSCAVEMQKALKGLSEEWQEDGVPELKMRIGINHGPAVVGNFGNSKRSDYSAIGPEVNLASRIESVCTPGETFISGTICDLIEENRFTEVGEYELKGVSGKTPLYKLS